MADLNKPTGKKRMWARLGVISALAIAITGAVISHLDTVTGLGVRLNKVEELPLDRLTQLVSIHSIGADHRGGYGAVNDKLDDMNQRNEDRFDRLERDVDGLQQNMEYIKKQQDHQQHQIDEIDDKGDEQLRKLDEILRELQNEGD